jgi:hypothetical protein
MKLLARIRCAFFGHPDTVIRWGSVRQLPGDKIDREVSEICACCAATLATSTLRLEEGRWTA